MRHSGWPAGLVVTLTACTAAGAGSGGEPAPPPEPEQVYTGTFTVLENAEHGPQLCAGGTLLSLPPQCGGPDIIGWTWDDVEHETVRGVSWGDYQVTGTFDGTVFTLTDPPGPPEPPSRQPQPPDPDLGTPCPAPAGGWVFVDVATASTEALAAVVDYAATLPGYGGLWVDREVEQPPDAPPPETAAGAILNVAFTDDLAAREAELRAVWGGALCVTEARHPHARLEEIQAELGGKHGIFSAAVMQQENLVDVQALIDDGLQERLDDEYGPGTVRVTASLRPVPPPDDAPTVYEGTFTVIERSGDGPHACSMVMESHPPQCGGGFELRGWSWDDVDGEESADGVTFGGSYRIAGTWDGTALTLTAPPEPPPPPGPPEDLSQRFDTPCPAPPGGWAIADGALTHAADFDRAHAYALAAPGYVDSWLDRHVAPEDRSAAAPAEIIVNFRFTGDLATHEAALRSLYGGAVCVSQAERSQQEMEAVGAEIAAEHDALAWTVETPANTVWIQVIVDDGVQEELDERYGPGMVRVEALLRPVD